MKMIKYGKLSVNVEGFRGMNKTDFKKSSAAKAIAKRVDLDKAWDDIQEALKESKEEAESDEVEDESSDSE